MDPCADHFDPRLRPPSGPAAGACLPAQQTSSLTSSSPSCPARHLPAQETPSPTRPAAFPPTPEARVAGAGVRSAARGVPDLGLPGAQGGRSGTQEAFTAEQHPGPYPPPGLPATACPPCAPSAPRPRPVCAPSAPQASGGGHGTQDPPLPAAGAPAAARGGRSRRGVRADWSASRGFPHTTSGRCHTRWRMFAAPGPSGDSTETARDRLRFGSEVKRVQQPLSEDPPW